MWVVTLSNGVVVYQSDDNPEFAIKNSWLGLKKHVENHNLYIKDMVLRFRDHVEVIGSGAPAYYFVHMVLANIVGWVQTFYKIGTLREDGKIHGETWIIPELMTAPDEPSFVRDPDDPKVAECIIRGKPSEQG